MSKYPAIRFEDRLRRGTKVVVRFEGTVYSSIPNGAGGVCGYRIDDNDSDFLAVVPLDAVFETLEDEDD